MGKREFIGGSVIAKIADVSEWGSPADAYQGFMEEINLTGDRLDAGKYYEDGTARHFADTYGKTITKKFEGYEKVKHQISKLGLTIFHPAKPYLGATPDRFILDENSNVEGILELKFSGDRNAKTWKDGEPPRDYILQLQWYMHIYNKCFPEVRITLGVLYAWCDGFQRIDVNYDADLGDMLEMAADDFWINHIIPKIPPEISERTNESTIKKFYPGIATGKEITCTVTPDFLAEYKALSKEITEKENQKKEMKKQIAVMMKDGELALSNDLVWKIKASIVSVPEKHSEAFSYKKITVSKTPAKDREKLLEFKNQNQEAQQ